MNRPVSEDVGEERIMMKLIFGTAVMLIFGLLFFFGGKKGEELGRSIGISGPFSAGCGCLIGLIGLLCILIKML